MKNEKKLGGRPKGSGIDDRKKLEKVADMIAKDPSLKSTTAIKKAVSGEAEHNQMSAVRRLQRKWKDTGEERLVEAQQKQAESTQRSPGRWAPRGDYLSGVGSLVSELEKASSFGSLGAALADIDAAYGVGALAASMRGIPEFNSLAESVARASGIAERDSHTLRAAAAGAVRVSDIMSKEMERCERDAEIALRAADPLRAFKISLYR